MSIEDLRKERNNKKIIIEARYNSFKLENNQKTAKECFPIHCKRISCDNIISVHNDKNVVYFPLIWSTFYLHFEKCLQNFNLQLFAYKQNAGNEID